MGITHLAGQPVKQLDQLEQKGAGKEAPVPEIAAGSAYAVIGVRQASSSKVERREKCIRVALFPG